MAINRIQFQKGLSLPEFQAQYGTEAQCTAALEAARCPEGFRCPLCGGGAHTTFVRGSRRYWQCGRFGHPITFVAWMALQRGGDRSGRRNRLRTLRKGFPQFGHSPNSFTSDKGPSRN
jgi:hypothetical protein